MFFNIGLRKPKDQSLLKKSSYTREELETFYYRDYAYNLSKVYEVDFLRFGWHSAGELYTKQTLLVKDWGAGTDTTNKYLLNLRDKTSLAKDIMSVGTYWPIITSQRTDGTRVIEEGHHRVTSAKLLGPDKWDGRKFLSIDFVVPMDEKAKRYYLDGDEIRLKKPVRMRVPFTAIFSNSIQDDEDAEKAILRLQEVNGTIIDDNTVEVEVYTYREFLLYLFWFPYWLRNLFYEENENSGIPILPMTWINDMADFDEWQKKVLG